jgi:hypothetical protein
MQKWYNKKVLFLTSGSVILILLFILFIKGQVRTSEIADIKMSEIMIDKVFNEEPPTFVKFLSFQNSDSTWGFTIFVNSRPYLHHKKIPFKKAKSGFSSKSDAESVAALFMKMIKNGNINPELSNNAIDSLGLTMN